MSKLMQPPVSETLAREGFLGRWSRVKREVASGAVPPGTVAEFHVPAAKSGNVRLSSGPLQERPSDRGRIVVELVPGEHEITLK